MKFVASVVSLLLLTVSLCFGAGPANVTSAQARTMISKNSKIFLLDVRTPEEYKQARLNGSLLIPVADLERRMKEVPKDRPVMVFCAVGSRSSYAANLLASKGYKEVYNMTDGLVGWYRNGFPLQMGR